MKADWLLNDKELCFKLVHQETVGEFLHDYYHEAKNHNRSLSYANIAIKMKVSKSLIVGIFQEKKPLTAKTLPALLKVLNLPPLLELYFKQLVSDSTDINSLDRFRSYFLDSLEPSRDYDRSVSDPDFPILYAALSDTQGSSAEELAYKTGWSLELVRFVLHELQLKKFVVLVSEERWKGTKLFLSMIAKDQQGWLPPFFQSSLLRHQQKSAKNFFANDHLSFVLSYCIEESEFSKMNDELKAVISTVVQKYHNDQGKKIVSLILGTHQN